MKKLPHKEFQEAITFFNEYFDEAGPEREATIIEELGTPKEAASDLINNILQRHIEGDKEVGTDTVRTFSIGKIHLFLLLVFVLSLLFSFILLSVEPILGIMAIFIVSIFGAFYLGKNWQEFKTTKKIVWLAILAVLSLPIAIPVLICLILLLITITFVVLGLLLVGLLASITTFIGGTYFIWEACSLFSQGFNVFLLGMGTGLSFVGGAILLFLLTGFFAYWSWQFIKASFKWILNRGKRV
ncbi:MULTISPECIES: hypothetical protein [unclassified Streptococcus]|uniref:HAAS signaling domain-containing protein n=1 Tax=Streptococcus sp. X16XC17 TaxID=2316646 RepID=UPI001F11373B|nr:MULTISPECIES: hypothetical protein [unclassified Streptococcus]